jgi:hypothetical protein
MSKIALTPNATGTGVFTISSPATNTDRTLTLPDDYGDGAYQLMHYMAMLGLGRVRLVLVATALVCILRVRQVIMAF